MTTTSKNVENNEEFDFKSIQYKWQELWDKNEIFNSEPSNKEKFFITIPYPYISGSLHIGHARVVTEADVFSRYQRMIGKNVLYPIAFHISGTPVLGISLAIKNGDEKKKELYRGYIKRYVNNSNEVEKILKSFENPEKIVEFFIPKMIEEFKTLGLGVDWRRSFTSGDFEHQTIVEWQFRKYKEKNYLVQGKYPILFSLTLNNAVGEDDIIDGDGNPVELQEFTGIKFEIDFNNSENTGLLSKETLIESKNKKFFLIAATLRPETMFGQTNMWVNPEIEYAIAHIKNYDEYWIISKECAQKLSYQDKHVVIVDKISGMDLMGKKCFAPFIEKNIIILPSMHCNPDIGTGIVTSVPSDAPFDYIALKELQDNPELCKRYNVDNFVVKQIELIPIIESKGFGKFPAVEICEKMNIKSLKDSEKLNAATQEIYKVGFHTGKMNSLCGEYSGFSVTRAKDEMKKKLLNSHRAEIIYETSRPAQSRDGGKVIVAILDNQWFLDFNAKNWKNEAGELLKNIELWPDKYRKQFEDVIDWLDKRPCARKRGLGTRLPFDKDWIIESLSDSTIYMALYPIIHLIRNNNITKEQLIDEFFDYVLNSQGNPELISKKIGVSSKELINMNKEWNYWYPIDQRHTFVNHLSNHLSFMIFAHTACFNTDKWPKRISFHGLIISEGEKMSKSKGNVISLVDLNERFGADPFRAFICNSTSVESTFNWQSDQVEIIKKQLINIFETIKIIEQNSSDKSIISNPGKFKSFISKTERAIKESKNYLNIMNLRGYSNIVLYEMLNNYKKVIRISSEEEISLINKYVGNSWIRMLSPLVPHIAEELWSINNKSFVSLEQWPQFNEDLINEEFEYEEELYDNLIKDIGTVIKLSKIESPKSIEIYIYETWKEEFFKVLKSELENTRNTGEILKKLMSTNLKIHGEQITKLVPGVLKDTSKIPKILKSQTEEFEIINSMKNQLIKEFNCEISIMIPENSKEPKAKQAMPGKPAILVK